MYKVCVNQINVHNIDEAIIFYTEKLGFEITSKEMYPHIVPLKNDGIYLLLSQGEKPTTIDYPKQAQSLINFQTDSLSTTMETLKDRGVEFLHAEPQQCPVGVFAAFRDPSGNVHEFVEFQN
ncbi:MAG: VOC family protein [Oligoflexales bacterium]|nr:VOC family protein [Oligoflexales bacterium]